MTMRDEIVGIIEDGLGDGLDLHDLADAIIAALPGMIPELVWESGVVDCAKLSQGGKYVACSTSPPGSWAWWLDCDGQTREVHNSQKSAKAAANAHHRLSVRKAMGWAE
jgi:hypothetical protein